MEKFFAEHARKGGHGSARDQKDEGGSVEGSAPPKKLPKGVVLGKDGKP